jgi:RecB family exonuclease
LRVLAQLDPVILEEELLARIEREHGSGELRRSLVVAPTARLAEQIQRRLSERRVAWLGLEVLHLLSLPDRILQQAGVNARCCSQRLLQALLGRQLKRSPENPWSRFVRQRPGALDGLAAAMTELRKAAIDPNDLAACRLDDSGHGLAEIYRRYHDALERLAADGWVDDAGLIRAALPHVARYAQPYASVFLHGAYELIGIQLDLIRALDRACGVTVLLPASAGAPVSAYAEKFAERFLLDDGKSLEPLVAAPGALRRAPLTSLYAEESEPATSEELEFDFRHCQGGAAEVRVAVRESLQAIRDGCPPNEIAIVAATLEPYVPALEEALDDEGLEWTSPATSPLGRQPVARDLILMLQALADDFPRRPTVELLASPRIEWRSLCDDEPPPRGDQADVWSREARLIGGLEEWVGELPLWAERPAFHPDQDDDSREEALRRASKRSEGARRIARTLRALHALVRPDLSRTWASHARSLRRALESLFPRPAEDHAETASAALLELLDDMARLETVVGDRREVPFRNVRDWVVEAAQGTELTLRAEDNGGIRVLDAMQARAQTFRQVHLLGMNAGIFPRFPREDPILTEALREQLRERTDRPVSLKGRGHLEQRLLLALALGSARERVVVSWQRADEAGKASNPSLALREVARIALGRPDLNALLERARHVPSHPLQSLQAFLERPGLLSAAEERLLTTLLTTGPESSSLLIERYPELEPGLRMIRATESFARVDAVYDARVKPLGRSPTLSVTSLQRLGRCPLQHFFRDVLGVRELEAEADLLEIAANEWGTRAHELLETVYRRLRDEGLFESNVDRLRRRAARLLRDERPRILGELGSRLARRLPVLWAQLTESWAVALEAFARIDLERIVAEGWTPRSFEELRSTELELDDEVRVTARGRFDRWLEREGQVLVGDYKTGRISRGCDVTWMLRGQKLQVPLYRMIAGGSAGVELLGIGPAHDPSGAEARGRFDGFRDTDQETGFRETLRVLLRLRERGAFPINSNGHCSWCAYVQACRRTHPPTIDREAASKDGESFRLVLKKNKSNKPTLARVRESRNGRREVS